MNSDNILLFLDIDGVLRPYEHRQFPVFPFLPRLENLLREFPDVSLVITSTQRELMLWMAVKEIFSPEIAQRIVGATPVHELRDVEDIAESRYREILAFLAGSNANWLALDDDATLYPADCPQLIECANGFTEKEESALRLALKQLCIP